MTTGNQERATQEQISTITLPLPFRLGTVNCYLVQTDAGYALIDTGCSNKRRLLETTLFELGCRPGNLKIILLTHGDFDHAGNAAHLRDRFSTPVAMHRDDFGMVERGDMYSGRDRRNRLLRWIAPLLFGFGQSERFKTRLSVTEDFDLTDYGFDAVVHYLPGHSRGSIGIRTSAGALFCGDLLQNTKRPAPGPIVDDAAVLEASVEKLRGLDITIVYPGHGRPFAMEEFISHR